MDGPRRPVPVSRRAAVASLGAGGLGLALAARALGAAAQDASPPAGIAPMELAPGVIAEVFAGVPTARAAGQTLYLTRFTFQPGAEIFPHSHPGTTRPCSAWIRGPSAGRWGPERHTSCAGPQPGRPGRPRI